MGLNYLGLFNGGVRMVFLHGMYKEWKKTNWDNGEAWKHKGGYAAFFVAGMFIYQMCCAQETQARQPQLYAPVQEQVGTLSQTALPGRVSLDELVRR